MAGTLQLSSLLARRRTEIIERWTQRIEREHQGKELSCGELCDHLPRIFDELVATLRAQESPRDTEPASIAHGVQRLRVGFDVVEVIREYEILADCILDELDAAGRTISTQTFRRVQNLLNTGRAHAVSAYVERRDEDIAREHSQHVAFVAHELRGPLMAAFLSATALQKQARPEDNRGLSILARNLKSLRELIDQVLIADRLASRVQLTRETFDLRELFEEVVTDAGLAAERNRVELVIDAPDTLPFNGDRRLIRSAVSNIVGNAVKFTHEGRAITLRATRSGGFTTIEVEDGCGGLPEGNPEELFEPLVQRGNDRSGFGLGLAIVKQAIEAHGGSARVRSLPGRGCVFSLEMPESPA
ncbi:MAG TPA: sensor histidine kinase [Steroidobacteraceae bacterium]